MKSNEINHGTFVTVTEETINWGYEHDKERANKYLVIGQKYEVVETRAYNWYTNVCMAKGNSGAWLSIVFT
jgi:hypothetical protein